MTDVLERLRASDPAANARGWAASPAGESVRERIAPAPQRRRSWLVAVAAAVVVLALVVGVAFVTTATDTSRTKPVSAIQRLVHGKWHRLPEPPISPAGRAQLFETNKGILLWAEYSDSGTPPGFHLALYDPATEKWKKLAEPPVVLTTDLYAWTGEDLVFPGAALAYNLRTDRWRTIPPSPVDTGSGTRVVWAPPHVVVVHPACPLCQAFLMSDGPVGSAAFDPARGTWEEIQSPTEGFEIYALGWSGKWIGAWGVEQATPRGAMQMLGPLGSWESAIGYDMPTQAVATALVRVRTSLVWVHWNSATGEVEWRRSFSPALVDLGEPSLPHPSICAVQGGGGPTGSAIIWCAQGERLHLLDTVRNRWFELPATHQSIQPTVLWSRGSLYAMAADGHLLALR